MAIPIASQAAGPSPAKSKTLVFHVVFSPEEFIQANNVRNPHSQFSLGDELVFHDQLFSGGQHVVDEAGSCVLVDVSQAPLANCTMVVQLPGGTITGQFLNGQPPHKQIAITGGTGVYDAAGGDGTLVVNGRQVGETVPKDRSAPCRTRVAATAAPGLVTARSGEAIPGARWGRRGGQLLPQMPMMRALTMSVCCCSDSVPESALTRMTAWLVPSVVVNGLLK